MSDNVEFAGPNTFTNSPTLEKISNKFSKFDQNEEFGRESLGIFDINNTEFGRESLSFLRENGKESLGILNFNVDSGRESISFLRDNYRDSLGFFNSNTDSGRESLSFLHDHGRESLGMFNVENTIFDKGSLRIVNTDSGRESLCFLRDDCKESLGIFNTKDVNYRQDPFVDFKNGFDFGRESLNFLCDNGKESLGLLNFKNRDSINFFQDDMGRESLGLVNLNSLDIGRESLGITNIRTYDFIVSNVNLPEIEENSENSTKEKETDENCTVKTIFTSDDQTLPEVLLSKTTENKNNNLSTLNTGFLQLPKLSGGSSISSIYPSFNSASLETTFPSRIFSNSTSSQTDLMNEAFMSTTDFLKKLQIGGSPTSSAYPILNKKCDDLVKTHRRINSLPSTFDTKFLECDLRKARDEIMSSDMTATLEKKNSSFLELNDDDFNDSVFIESKHVASRIADGSFLEAENDILDSIQEPEDFANVSSDEEELVKFDTEAVFKSVDKFLPCDNHTTESNTIDKSRDSNRNSSKNSASKSKEALEIINTLSEILNNDKPSEKLKLEGQNLLTSLAEILLSSASTKSRSCILDDSGHSSIESEPIVGTDAVECYEVLDLRKSSSETNLDHKEEFEDNCVPLDLSLKSKSTFEKTFVSPKILPPKFSKNQNKTVTIQINKSLGSNCSLSSNDSKTSNDSIKKFRPKKTDEKLTTLRKGPMKAVLPMDNMSRKNGSGLKITPTRPPNYKKKTSTPINDSNMKPMAQSTPDNPTRNTYPTSPLARPSPSPYSSPRVLKQKFNYSGSNLPVNKTAELKNPTKVQLKRTLSGDLKNSTKTERQFVRSYSVGEKSKPSFRIKEGVNQSLLAKQRHSYSFGKTENKPVPKERKSTGGVRSTIGRKVGKENVN